MTMNPAITIDKLLKEKLITRRLYNCLKFRQMETLGDLLEWEKKGKLKRPFFGRESLRDIEIFLNSIPELQSTSFADKEIDLAKKSPSQQTLPNKNVPPVAITPDFTIEQLRANDLLTDRAFSALLLMRVRDVTQLMEFKKKGLLDQHHFSLGALSDIKILFDKIEEGSVVVNRIYHYIAQSSKPSDKPTLQQDLSRQIANELAVIHSRIYPYESMAYETISKLRGKEADLLRELFPDARIMAEAILGEKYNLLTIYKDLGKAGNVTFRRMLLHYLKSIKKFTYKHIGCNSAYNTADRLSRYLESNINSFSNQEIIQNFLSSKQLQQLEQLYQKRVEELPYKAYAFQRAYLASFKNIVELFGQPETMLLERYNVIHEIEVLHEIWWMVQDMEDIFYEESQSGKEILLQIKISHLFPLLTSAEHRFVFLFHQENDSMPLFYIIYRMLKSSKRREISTYVSYKGVIDGLPQTLENLAKKNRLTTERTRQLCEKGGRTIKEKVSQFLNWGDYSTLLNANYITELSPKYRRIQEEENLPQNFHIFCSLLSILGDFEIVSIGEYEIAINKRFRDNGFYPKHIHNKLYGLIKSKRSKDVVFDLHSLVSELPSNLQEDAFWIVCQIAKTIPELIFDENWKSLLQRNYVDVPEECYNILVANNRLMTLEEIFQEFKSRFPEHKYSTPEKIHPYVLKHEHIRNKGKTGFYGLDSWNHIYYGNIRDLLRETLEASSIPLPLELIVSIVQQHFPTTNAKSITASMASDETAVFVAYEGGRYGLSYMNYPSKYKVEEENKRYSFEERMTMTKQFVDAYHRFPYSSGGEVEKGLQRWIYNVEHDLLDVTPKQKQKFDALLLSYRDIHIPENSLEESFLEMCQRYKAYIEKEFELPTRQGDIELYDWMIRSKANYNSYIDNRRYYLTELFNYIRSLGFNI